MAQNRNIRFLTKRTSVPGKIPTGTTGNELSFIQAGELASNLADYSLWGYDGTNVFEYGSKSFLGLTGGTVTGDTNFIGSLSAVTFFSGDTNLETIIYNIAGADLNDITRVQPGTNITTGGTENFPIVNLADDINITSMSAGTIYSGSTNLYDIFLTSADGNDITRVQPGNNTITGGTDNFPSVSVVDSPSFNNLSASGTSNFTGVIQSGGTDLYSIFLTEADGNDITRVQPGLNITTGGTDNFPVINLENDIDVTSLSADTIYSGSTNLYDIFLTSADGNDVTRVQPGTNTLTGGTDNLPTVSVVDSPSFNNLSASGASNFTGVIQSGGTDLYSIFLTEADGNDFTRVQPGVNTITGGTDNFPSVSVVDSPSFNDLSASGQTIVGGFTADTIFSGSSNLYDIFLTSADGNDITRVQPGTNINTGGTDNFPIVNLNDNVDVSSISADTIYSGSTNLEDFIITEGKILDLHQSGTTVTSGGTGTFTVMSWDSTAIEGDIYSRTSTDITVNTDGLYEIEYSISLDRTSGDVQ